MDVATTAVLWLALLALVAVALDGVRCLARTGRATRAGGKAGGSGNSRKDWARVLLGLWGLLTILPHLLSAGALTGLILALVGLVPLAAVVLLLRQRASGRSPAPAGAGPGRACVGQAAPGRQPRAGPSLVAMSVRIWT